VACVEVPVISRTTGQVVGSGVGAASTLETKYKYRWVANPQEWGYDEASLKTFKTKTGKDDEGNETTLYRIPNPEHSELLNTIVKMASKRAEVDAAESLPGVASVLRQMFSGKKFTKGDEKGEYEGPVWQRFWGEVRRLGLTDHEAHVKLGVISMKDWLAKGRSLDEAVNILRDKEPEGTEESEQPTKPRAEKPKRDPDTIKTINELYKACNEDWGMQPKDVLKELGISSQNDIADTPANCYRQIAAVRA